MDTLLEASGVLLPKFSRSAARQLQSISRDPKNYYFLDEPKPEFKTSTVLAFKFQSEKIQLSPSSIEQLIKCPAKFYFQNLLKIKDVAQWDPEKLDPSLKGKWIHATLEQLFKIRPPVGQTQSAIDELVQNILKELLARFFEDQSSLNYQHLISLQIPELSRLISAFYKIHESVFTRHFPQRSLFFETKLQATFQAHSFRFVCDRIDVLVNGNYLLWDYKTGQVPKGKVETLLKNGSIQLPLYTALIKSLDRHQKEKLNLSDDSQCVGMGFLSPLDPTKNLYFHTVTTEAAFGLLAEMEGSKSYPFDEAELLNSLAQAIQAPLEIIRKGIFEPHPKTDSLCQPCAHRYICGKNFLELQTANQDLEAGENS
jgi:ATP-dependent helicase/DNAse subunit B